MRERRRILIVFAHAKNPNIWISLEDHFGSVPLKTAFRFLRYFESSLKLIESLAFKPYCSNRFVLLWVGRCGGCPARTAYRRWPGGVVTTPNRSQPDAQSGSLRAGRRCSAGAQTASHGCTDQRRRLHSRRRSCCTGRARIGECTGSPLMPLSVGFAHDRLVVVQLRVCLRILVDQFVCVAVESDQLTAYLAEHQLPGFGRRNGAGGSMGVPSSGWNSM